MSRERDWGELAFQLAPRRPSGSLDKPSTTIATLFFITEILSHSGFHNREQSCTNHAADRQPKLRVALGKLSFYQVHLYACTYTWCRTTYALARGMSVVLAH